MNHSEYDLCVIGGGINGAGIARDAAGRGLSVLLVEAQDLAGATSSASTKLIHGGLRYLEHFEFRLVHDALKERETLLSMAPHIIRPMRFVMPHNPDLRPAWMIRLGLFLYDHLAGRKKLKASKGITFRRDPTGEPLRSNFTHGFSYADCWVEDARLVVLNAKDAEERGAAVFTHTACTKLEITDGREWAVHLQDMRTRRPYCVKAKQVVNAAGPWVRGFLENSGLVEKDTPDIRLVKGSHIVVRRIYDGDHAYIFQQPDDRIVFVIPYEKHYTLIGTTDIDYEGDPSEAVITDKETNYLCAAVNRYFKTSVIPGDVIWSYSGVRPLIKDEHEDASSVTRDYKLVKETRFGPPLLSVFGGKITTYRILAEEAVDMLTDKPAWTKGAPLPGGNIEGGDIETYIKAQKKKYPFLLPEMIDRYARTYGTRMDLILCDAQDLSDLGRHFGDDLYEAEIRYLMSDEWAISTEDILMRRTKLGLHISETTLKNLESYLSAIPKKSRQKDVSL